MSHSLHGVRWFRVLSAAVTVVVASFLVLMVIVTIYAIILALQVRGTPDQNAINHFAAQISPRLMPWLEMLLTLVVTFRIAHRAKTAGVIHGLFIGILAGLISLAVILIFGGQPGWHNLLIMLLIIGLGCLGGFLGQGKSGTT